jgi:CRP/FNR family cyclic AMP-dependent transcriptional regulator
MRKILLIANDPAIRAMTTDILALAHHQVLLAQDGKSGVELAETEHPDVIITEVAMPGLDGYGVMHLLQSYPWFYNTLFIVLCAACDKGELRRAMTMGADDVIIKPFDGTELLSCIEVRSKKREWLSKANGNGNGATPISIPIQTEKELMVQLISDRNIDRYNRRQLIYKKGDRPTKLFYLINGKARSYNTHADGKDLAIDLFGPGDFLGYSDIIKNHNYSESVETIDYAELAVIPRSDFEELVFQNTVFAKRFVDLVITRSRTMEQRLLWMAYHSLRQKVAAALLHLKDKYGNGQEEPFEVNLNRSIFASIAGTATESSIRTLGEFRSEKLIELEADGTIRVINEKKLAQLLG